MLRVYCILQYILKFFGKVMLKAGKYARITGIKNLHFEKEVQEGRWHYLKSETKNVQL